MSKPKPLIRKRNPEPSYVTRHAEVTFSIKLVASSASGEAELKEAKGFNIWDAKYLGTPQAIYNSDQGDVLN